MAPQLKRFTDEQIERANRVDIVDYARSQGLELKRAGKSYRVANYSGGFYITPEKNSWNWFNEERGGGVVQLCMELENKTWPEAVRTLLNEDMEPIRHTREWKPEPEPQKEFHLPSSNDNYRHVFAYLIKSRGIDATVLKEMVDKKYIYENTKNSCVFVGRDKDGIPRHASVRSTNTQGKAFKQDVPGSKKEFSFSISGTSGTLNVFEAPIDALSYMSLQRLYGKQTNDSYLSLGGVTDKALERFLNDYDIDKIRVCTDADEAGEKAVARIYEKYHEQYKIVRHRPQHKDFNEDLIALRQQQKMQEQNNIQQPSQNQSIDKSLLQQSGISADLIKWYESKQDSFQFHNNIMTYEGSSGMMIVCENPNEVMAFMEIDRLNYTSKGSAEPYRPDDHFVTYSSVKQIAAYMEKHPSISMVGVATSRTEHGTKIFNELQSLQTHNIVVGRMAPKLTTFVQDVQQMKALETAIEQTPIEESQPDMVAGMEA